MESAALLAAPGVLNPTGILKCIIKCISLLGGDMGWVEGGVWRRLGRHVGTILGFFSVLSASWAHFSRLAGFVAPFGRFFRDLGRSSLDF